MTRFQLFRLTIAAMTAWSTALTATIGAEITRLRGDRSAQWVADRTRKLGHPVSRTTIWEIETGRKKSVAVPELLVIARALEMPPTLLLFPGVPDRKTWALPNWHTSASVASHWFTGDRNPAPITGDGNWENEESFEETARLSSKSRLAALSGQLESARWSWLHAQSEIGDEGDTADMEKVQRLAVWELQTRSLVDHLEAQVEDLGGEVNESWVRFL